MANITASDVMKLRQMTGVSMMECKKALVQTDGDKAAAIRILRERGVAVAAKRAARTAKEGVIASCVSEDAQTGTMVEVNCETDFVAKNEGFKAFVQELLADARGAAEGTIGETAKAKVEQKIAEIGENIVARRNVTLSVQGTGAIVSYIHMGGKFGVLAEIGCGKEQTKAAAEFKELATDLALQITAAAPLCVTRDQVPAELVENEKAIYAKQVENKPAQIIEKIVGGKLDKYFSGVCLLEQEYVKENSKKVSDVIAEVAKKLGDEICVRRFVRWQLGA